MGIPDYRKRVAIRKQSFENHLLCCSDCTVPESTDGPQEATLCLSGKIMLAHYVRALRE